MTSLTCKAWWWWWWRFSCQVASNSCDPMDRGAWQATVHGILQAGILEWVAISFSRGTSQPTALAGRFCTTEPPGRHLFSLRPAIWLLLGINFIHNRLEGISVAKWYKFPVTTLSSGNILPGTHVNLYCLAGKFKRKIKWVKLIKCVK